MLQVFKPRWRYPGEIETWLTKEVKGKFSLHLPCGLSKVGSIRADVDPSVKPDIICDALHPPFRPQSFDIVISDPPWKFFAKLRWINTLSALARQVFWLNAPIFIIRLKNFIREIHVLTRSNRNQVSIWVKYTRKQTTLDLVNYN